MDVLQASAKLFGLSSDLIGSFHSGMGDHAVGFMERTAWRVLPV